MTYIKRAIENILEKARTQSKIVLLTGARQVGKTTVIRETFPQYAYLTLDDENELMLAKTDPRLFFREREYPLIIDEVQYVPELFRTIKLIADRSAEKGQLFLTGSQTYSLLSSTTESLSGRVTVLELLGLSLRERFGISCNEPFLPDDGYISRRKSEYVPYRHLWELIHRGSMPELTDEGRDWEWFYRDYVRTYLERDVRQMINVKDELKFRNFLTSIAARSGQILIYDEVARDVGIDIKTVQHWLSVVAASGIVRIVHTYANNIIKRVIKSPKIYMTDTGLLCYLLGWKTPETAEKGAMSGNIFETFVVSEILKSYVNAGFDAENIYYYRDADKKEIDLVIADGDVLYPVEIKKSAQVSREWIKNFDVLKKVPGKKIGKGAVVCLCEHPVPITEDVTALPIEFI